MKRPNGYGTIVCLDKTKKKRRKPYAVRITVGMTEDGRQRTKYLGYYASQKEAQIALAQYHMIGLDIDSAKLTFEEVFEQWINQASTKMTKKNQQSYRAAFRLVSILHKRKFKDIKANHLQMALDGIKLKYNTKKKVRSMLKQVWDYAVKNDFVVKNYAIGLEIVEKPEEVGSAFTHEEINLLWDNSDDYHVRIILFLIYSGLRVNELLSLTVDQFHLDDRYFVAGSKTDAGKDRRIPIHEAVYPFVLDAFKDSRYLLYKEDKTGVSYSTFEKDYKNTMKRLNLNHFIHDTRKTTVSLLHTAEVPMETIKFIVGHSQQGVTAKVYLKKEINELVVAINKIPAYFV